MASHRKTLYIFNVFIQYWYQYFIICSLLHIHQRIVCMLPAVTSGQWPKSGHRPVRRVRIAPYFGYAGKNQYFGTQPVNKTTKKSTMALPPQFSAAARDIIRLKDDDVVAYIILREEHETRGKEVEY